MKKRLVALITILLLVASLSLSTFAADGFNKAVFNNAADVTVKADDMTGDAIFATTSLLGADGEISVARRSLYMELFQPIVALTFSES